MGNRNSRRANAGNQEQNEQSPAKSLTESLVVVNKYSNVSSDGIFNDGEDDVFVAGSNTGIHCLLPPTTLPLTSVGEEREASGLRIRIPHGAVEGTVEASLTVAVVITTLPCTYPNDVKQISPVFMLHPSIPVDLKKPIEITIPHFLHGSVAGTEIEDQIGVLKADDENLNAKAHYFFNKVKNCRVTLGVSEEGEGVATFQVQHFCFFQLYSDSSINERALKAAYCLCRMEPRAEQYPRVYYYVLTYKMKVFIQAVEKQFPYYKRGKFLEFQFENPQDRRVFVKNHFEVENWNITFEDSQTDGDEYLHASSLERWGDGEQDIEFDIDCDLYPPKFKLQICPKNPDSSCGSIEVCVPFKGITKITDTRESVVDHFMVVHSNISPLESVVDSELPENTASKMRLQVIKANRNRLCLLIQHDIANVADILLQHKLIPVELKSSAQQVDGISNATKTRRVIDVICDQVAVDPNKYDVFITALKDAGEYINSLVEELEKAVSSIPSPHSSVSQLQTVDHEESDIEESDTNSAVLETRSPAVTQVQPLGVNGYSILSYISRSQTTTV